MYDPKIGRFFGIDPIIEELIFLTPYNYASNNPITLIDYWGLQGINPNEVKIVFKSGVSDSKVSNYSIQILQRIGGISGNQTVNVNSTYRSPKVQINIIYKQTLEKGADAQFKLYGSKGDKVVQSQLDATNVKGATETSIKSTMTATAEEVGFISAHSSSKYESRNAIDIKRSDFTGEQIKSIKSEILKIDNNIKFIDESDRNCLHFEISYKKAEYTGGLIEDVTINGNGNKYIKSQTASIKSNSIFEELKLH